MYLCVLDCRLVQRELDKHHCLSEKLLLLIILSRNRDGEGSDSNWFPWNMCKNTVVPLKPRLEFRAFKYNEEVCLEK